MDFIRILQSLEEFLYEVMSWLVFFPRTLWRTIRHPVAVAVYTTHQLKRERPRQFTEMVSPALMLILALVLAHGVELVSPTGMAKVSSVLGKELFGSEQSMIATRSVMHCIYALFGALGMLYWQRTRVDRDTLRPPFYIHCYLVAVFALGMAIGSTMSFNLKEPWNLLGIPVYAVMSIWYVAAQTAIYTKVLQLPLLRAFLTASIANLAATFVVFGFACLLLL